MLFQERFLAQDLTVEEPDTGAEIDQQYPVGEDQELPKQDRRKGHINGIAAKGKNASRNELIGMVGINAHSETLSKRDQAPQEQQ